MKPPYQKLQKSLLSCLYNYYGLSLLTTKMEYPLKNPQQLGAVLQGLRRERRLTQAAAGAKGKRYALQNSRIMIHQPWGGAQGTASDIEIQAQEILRMKDILSNLLAKHTGKTKEQVLKDSDRDKFMSAQEAKDYGLVDEVIITVK